MMASQKKHDPRQVTFDFVARAMDDASARLNAAIQGVEAELSKLNAGVTDVSVRIPDSQHSLTYARDDKDRQWKLTVLHSDGVKIPLRDSNRHIRAQSAKVFKALYDRMRDKAETVADEVESGAEVAEDFLAYIKGQTR